MNNKEKWNNLYDSVIEKVIATSARLGNQFPNLAREGEKFETISCRGWVTGFWPGMLLKAYKHTGDESLLERVRDYENQHDEALLTPLRLHHDVGFMWYLGAVKDYILTGFEKNRERGLCAALMLSARYNPMGRFIRAWNDPNPDLVPDNRGWVIVDCMMNLELLYWASETTKDPRFRHIADFHAQTVQKNFIRENGTVTHIVCFDPETGERTGALTGQGYSENSSWTRGMGWAVYGFSKAYRCTGNKSYLETAKKVADTFMEYFEKTGYVPCDYLSPKEPVYYDSSAAAIVACGMLEMAMYGGDEYVHYADKAQVLIDYLNDGFVDLNPDTDGILQKSTHEYHGDRHNISIIYGDYYYMEAVEKFLEYNKWI